MVTTATLRSILQFYADLSSEFSSLYQYERSGLGSCWDWDLTTFDVDPNPLSTLTDCFKHDSVQVLFSSHLVRDVNTFKIESADAFFIGVTWSINTFQMQPVDDWYMSYQMSDDTLDKSLICWASINNEIYAALLHDMPYLSLPLIILISYVSFVFYRPDNTSHIPLAYAALANVLMAVFAGLGYMMWMGSPFTALHICAVYITLGVGVDDAFIIAQSIFNEESVNANLGKVERIKRGLGKCGPSLLLTSLTNFCAFMSNASSTVFAIRNFSMVAAMMIIIDYVLQITFFVACCSLDLGRKEKGGGGLCGTKAGEEIAGRKTKTSNAPALSVSVSPSTPTSGRRRSSSADFYNDRFKDDIWSRKLVGTTLPNVILSKWGKVAVLLITAMMMCVGLYGTNYLYISYTPYLLIPKDSYIHEGRAVMHTYFPWVMEESFTCVQLKEFDYSTNQEELKELEDYVCRLASRDQCFAWYSLFRFYVMTKYYGNLEYAMTEDGWVNPDIFYEELAAYGEDETMGGKDVAFQFMRWKSRDELYGSQYCFMWKQVSATQGTAGERTRCSRHARNYERASRADAAPLFTPYNQLLSHTCATGLQRPGRDRVDAEYSQGVEGDRDSERPDCLHGVLLRNRTAEHHREQHAAELRLDSERRHLGLLASLGEREGDDAGADRRDEHRDDGAGESPLSGSAVQHDVQYHADRGGRVVRRLLGAYDTRVSALYGADAARKGEGCAEERWAEHLEWRVQQHRGHDADGLVQELYGVDVVEDDHARDFARDLVRAVRRASDADAVRRRRWRQLRAGRRGRGSVRHASGRGGGRGGGGGGGGGGAGDGRRCKEGRERGE